MKNTIAFKSILIIMILFVLASCDPEEEKPQTLEGNLSSIVRTDNNGLVVSNDENLEDQWLKYDLELNHFIKIEPASPNPTDGRVTLIFNSTVEIDEVEFKLVCPGYINYSLLKERISRGLNSIDIDLHQLLVDKFGEDFDQRKMYSPGYLYEFTCEFKYTMDGEQKTLRTKISKILLYRPAM